MNFAQNIKQKEFVFILMNSNKIQSLSVKKENMGRNNEKNIKKHNDKLHKEQAKTKQAALSRKEKLKEIVKKFNENNPPAGN